MNPTWKKTAAIAAAVATTACGDLAMEPDRVPTSLTVTPTDLLITEGDRAALELTVLDQDGSPFPAYPSWAPPVWSVSDQGAISIAPDGGVNAMSGGEIQVEADLAGLTAKATVRINPVDLALSAPTVYLVQSTQNPQGDVPIVADREAFLRVFVTGDEVSFFQPRVVARFFLDGEETYAASMQPGSYLLPESVDESRLDRSFNATIPGSVLQPGVEMVVELDPEGTVPLAPGAQPRIPARGRLPLDVRRMPVMDLTIVPVLLESNPDDRVFNWTGGLRPESDQLSLARAVLPIGDLDVHVHETFTTTADLTTDTGWNRFLREIRLLRVAEGELGYYYGAVTLPPRSKWGGLGYIGLPASVGAPSDRTFAHELGHNLSLRHAPCGGVASFDPNFPYSSGEIGMWGYDPEGGSGLGDVVDPGEYKDLMGYCSPRWVSDYHFKKAMDFRLASEVPPEPSAQRAPREKQEVLLLWGSAGPSGLVLEPAFVLEAPPALPGESGPYRIQGFDAEGGRRFSFDFQTDEVEFGGGHFSFAIPFDGSETLDRITLTGPEGTTTLDRSGGPRAALVTNRSTGRVRALVRDWDGESFGPETRIQLSEGLPLIAPPGDSR